ncbi:MAG TPA: hypothetical protein VFZ31_06450 [Vicinamibacterales bacterium]
MKNLLAIIGFTVGVAQPSLLWAAGQASAPTASADAAAIKQFDDAVLKYMAMRKGVRSEVSGPVKDSTSSQVNNASDALAGSIQRARQGAQVGAIFTPSAAAVIKRRIAETVRTEKLEPALADIDDEGKAGPTPKVHLRLPISAQMATMPPALLKVLPQLPKELEYRIIGNYLVLRDVDAALVVDYLPGAVPR